MGRKKKSTESDIKLTPSEVANLQQSYMDELNSDEKYSLEVDPRGLYSMGDEQKEFILQYVQFKSVAAAADLMGIDMETARAYFMSYSSQQEIRRINMALYHRQFANKLLSLDEIGGYLTSLLTGENVPLADQLHTKDKLKVIELILKINEMKAQSFLDPSIIIAKDISSEIQDLSVGAIQRLLEESNRTDNSTIVDNLDVNNELTNEEKEYLRTLPTKDLLEMLNNMEGGKNDGDQQTTNDDV